MPNGARRFFFPNVKWGSSGNIDMFGHFFLAMRPKGSTLMLFVQGTSMPTGIAKGSQVWALQH
jgi:hypothetical protein